ncbi:hypothetical protein CAPTEDRAFT_211565 [Capitella teleta]|uniref:C2H2-type domain-containing protein n=1 Tax=Capitella teleta TaxID=283909 RepID=R7T3U7_CAPTE|nr:hypothetical protein CAPTEDRAFT_211565 [Capitella teleta]|eukprot:ELT87438.1 hypothetical protein CAPTEDRAFT_211565 [Capitella teleta]
MLKHYEYVHNYDKNLQLSCGVSGCAKVYRSVRYLKKHIQQYHSDLFHLNDANGQEETVLDYLNLGSEEIDEFGGNENNDADVIDITSNRPDQTHPASDAIAFEVGGLLMLSNEILVQKLRRHFEIGSLDETGFADILNQHNALTSNLSEALSSGSKLQTYVKKHMTYIEPISISLNVSGDAPDDDDSDGDDGMLPMQYIPILKTLKALLNQEDVLAQVLEDRRSKDGVIRDFCDGDVFRESPLFQQHPNALQVMLYNDEFSCTIHCAIGARITKFLQFTLCLPLINDLKLLETEVCVDGSNYHFYGTVSFVAADNLAAHGLGGFFENFSSALKLCRFCNATKESMALSFDEKRFILRTSSSYDAQVKLVCQNKVLASTYGVKHPSPLNQLAFFHVCNGLTADIAHDLFEGFVHESIELVLASLVRKDFFTVAHLNDVIDQFDYSVVDKANKPPPVSLHGTSPKLRLTQSQMWTFARLLPFFVGDHVPQETCDEWKFFLQLLDYIEHLCAQAFDLAELANLKELTEDLHTSFCSLFEHNVKPKRHFSIHYPGLIKKIWTPSSLLDDEI